MIKLIKHAVNLVKHSLRDVGTGKQRSPHWHTVEKHFLETNPTCAACGGKEKLNVHHCVPFHLDPEKELDPNNLITLCMKMGQECHLLIGHGGSFKAFNENVREDAAEALKNPVKFNEIVKLAEEKRK